jgi:hypothetical protein
MLNQSISSWRAVLKMNQLIERAYIPWLYKTWMPMRFGLGLRQRRILISWIVSLVRSTYDNLLRWRQQEKGVAKIIVTILVSHVHLGKERKTSGLNGKRSKLCLSFYFYHVRKGSDLTHACNFGCGISWVCVLLAGVHHQRIKLGNSKLVFIS